jgi:hypothetical protein
MLTRVRVNATRQYLFGLNTHNFLRRCREIGQDRRIWILRVRVLLGVVMCAGIFILFVDGTAHSALPQIPYGVAEINGMGAGEIGIIYMSEDEYGGNRVVGTGNKILHPCVVDRKNFPFGVNNRDGISHRRLLTVGYPSRVLGPSRKVLDSHRMKAFIVNPQSLGILKKDSFVSQGKTCRRGFSFIFEGDRQTQFLIEHLVRVGSSSGKRDQRSLGLDFTSGLSDRSLSCSQGKNRAFLRSLSVQASHIGLLAHFLIGSVHFAQLPIGDAGVDRSGNECGSSGDCRNPRRQQRPPLKAIFLLALGLLVSWYISVGRFYRSSYSGDDPPYLITFFVGSLGCFAYGMFLLSKSIFSIAQVHAKRFYGGTQSFSQSFELAGEQGDVVSWEHNGEYEIRIPRRLKGGRELREASQNCISGSKDTHQSTAQEVYTPQGEFRGQTEKCGDRMVWTPNLRH